jgi:hypothetical protein
LQKGYHLVVKGLINANRGQNAHWNPTVNTLTMTVMRSYMEINRDMFEKISGSNQQEEIKKNNHEKNLQNKWEFLEKKYVKN